ncbi:MAG: hypothetical protein ABR863_11170 [Roseiarcus sp.]
MIGVQQFVRNPAAGEDPDGGGDKRQHGEKSDFHPGHVPLGGQIGREPGEEEHQGRIAGELADAGAPDLAVGQQLADVRPGERHAVLGVQRQSAAFSDMIEFGFVDGGVIARLAKERQPNRGEREADDTDDDERGVPAIGRHQPE